MKCNEYLKFMCWYAPEHVTILWYLAILGGGGGGEQKKKLFL
jgi:hypothetical protein